MRKIINAMQLKRFNVKQKFAIIIIVLVLVFSLVFSLGYYLIYSLLLDSLIINQYQSLGIVKQEISQYFTGINKKIDEFTSTPSVREYLYGYSDPQDERFLIRFKKDLHESTAMPFLNSVFVIKKDSYLGSNYNSQIDNDNIDDLIEYIKSKYSSNFKSQIISVPLDELNENGLIFYCVPIHLQQISRMDEAFIAIDIDPKIFDSTLSRNMSAMTDTFPFGYIFFDEHKNIIYSSKGFKLEEQEIEDILVTGNQYEQMKMNGKSTLILNYSIYESKIFVCLRLGLANVLSPTLKYSTIVIAMVVLAIVFIWLFTNQMTKGITKRLSQMLAVMDKAEKGDLDVSYNIEHNDEISIIGKKFNTMIKNLKNMKINMMALKLRQKEAELSNLQSYIKPHFLINTIESIRMTAVLENDKVTAEQLMILGKLFRYMNSFNKEFQYVTVRDEVENVKVYLALIKLRFQDKYQISMEVDEEILDYSSLQLIIQPIIENVFIHGLRNKLTGSMVVYGYIRGKDIVFDIIDDGEGISREKLIKISNSFAATETYNSGSSIGMHNVNARLKLAYGEQYGVTIYSELGKGTRVRLVFPVCIKDEKNKSQDEDGNV